MYKAITILVGVLCIAAVQGKYVWKCPEVKPTEFIDFRAIKGTWYVYGYEPSRWFSMCYNYTIQADSNDDYTATEEYFKAIIHTKSSKTYALKNCVNCYDITFKTKGWIYTSSDSWTVIDSDKSGSNGPWMILYKCGTFKEQVQIWTRNPLLTSDSASGSIPKKVEESLAKININLSDLDMKKPADCQH